MGSLDSVTRVPSGWLRPLLPLLLLLAALGCSAEAPPTPASEPPLAASEPPPIADPQLASVRISYPTQDGVFIWGMVSQIFERTDLLQRNGLRPQFVRCDDSPDLAWSVVHGDADVSLMTTGVMGVTMICGRPYKIVSALGAGGRNALIVRSDSPAQRVSDLKGKRVENPILGGLLERFLSMDGLEPTDVEVYTRYNYDGDSVNNLLTGQTDALMYWDPLLVPLLREEKVRVLIHDPYHLEVAMLSSFMEQRPEVAESFMVALLQALYWVMVAPEQPAAWYSQISGLPAEDMIEAMEWVEVVETYREHPGLESVHLASTDHAIADVKGVIGAMGGYGVFDDLRLRIDRLGLPGVEPLETNEVDVMPFLDVELARRAEVRFVAEGFDPAAVTITGLDPDAAYLTCHGRR